MSEAAIFYIADILKNVSALLFYSMAGLTVWTVVAYIMPLASDKDMAPMVRRKKYKMLPRFLLLIAITWILIIFIPSDKVFLTMSGIYK